MLTEREEKASAAIGSNESFSGWTKTVTDPRLCASIVDRLTFDGTIIETGTDSYRPPTHDGSFRETRVARDELVNGVQVIAVRGPTGTRLARAFSWPR